jgi:hypothetical protein
MPYLDLFWRLEILERRRQDFKHVAGGRSLSPAHTLNFKRGKGLFDARFRTPYGVPYV